MNATYFERFDNNAHLSKLLEYFGHLNPTSALIPPNVSFLFICFTNRCGSNYLAELLASSGEYNLAGEFLNWDTVKTHCDRHDFKTFQDYFSFLALHRQRSGRLCMKISTTHLELLGHTGILDQIMPRSQFIVVERGDKLDQAISYSIAFATGRFTSWMAGTRSPEEVEFSRRKIDQLLVAIAEAHKSFAIFFAKNGVVPATVNYEQIIMDPVTYMDFVMQQLELPKLPIQFEKLKLERQRTRVNEAWRHRYLKGDG